MSVKKSAAKIKKEKKKIEVLCYFWGALCLNVLNICLLIYAMFTYDSAIGRAQAFGIRDAGVAHSVFSSAMLVYWLNGLLFCFPLIWCFFFTKKIDWQAVLMQLLPILVIAGFVLFS